MESCLIGSTGRQGTEGGELITCLVQGTKGGERQLSLCFLFFLKYFLISLMALNQGCFLGYRLISEK